MKTTNGFLVIWDKYWSWWANAKNFHQRAMMRYLKKRNWVVFYLEPQVRECKGEMCWMKLYVESEKADTHFTVS